MQVGVNSTSSGAKSGTVNVELLTDGSVSGVAEVFANANVQVSGEVYEYAVAQINNDPLVFGNFREGDTVAAQGVSITNGAQANGFGENLDASFAGAAPGILTSGSIDDLVAQGSDNTSMTVSIDTATAGDKSGVATIDFVSDGNGINSLGQTALGSQDVQVTGAVYRLAQMDATPGTVNLGNFRVGNTAETAVAVGNTAANDGYSEQLEVTGSVAAGSATVSGAVAGLIDAGASDSGIMVGIDTGSAGAKSGTVTISGESNGTNTSGFTTNVGLADAVVNVSGNVYRMAQGSATPDPVAFANSHVGDTVSQAITVSNTATADMFSESLGVSATASGNAGVSGAVGSLIAAGASDSGLSVSIDTSTAGAKSGTLDLSYTSDGTGTSGLAAIGAGSQSIAVSGNVYRLAEATIDNPLAFNLGSVHVGDMVSQAVSISNTAVADMYSESLNASFGGANDARILNNGGTVNQLAAGGTDGSSMVVSLDTSAAGTIAGTQTINFASDGTGTSGLGVTGLPSQNLSVTASISATAYRLANPVINNVQPVAFGNYREGDAVTAQNVSITNDVLNDGLSEVLNASANGTTGGVLSSGSFTGLAPEATDNASIAVSIDTATAGNKSGVATIDFESDGTGTSGLGITTLASQDVQVTGAVYRLAQIGVAPNPITLNARVGDMASAVIDISNTAANDGYSEDLKVTGRTDSGDVASSGMIGGLIAAGATDSNISVALNTVSSGAKSGSVAFTAVSDGTQTSGFLTDAAIPGATVNVLGNVWQTAVADVQPTVDFGIVHVGDSVADMGVGVSNTASGALVDVVRGGITSTTGSAFSGGGNLGAGVATGGSDSSNLLIALDTSSAGTFSGTANVDLTSHNDDLADVSLGTTTVVSALSWIRA